MMKYEKPEMELIKFETVCTVVENSMLYQDSNDLGGNYAEGGEGGQFGDYFK